MISGLTASLVPAATAAARHAPKAARSAVRLLFPEAPPLATSRLLRCTAVTCAHSARVSRVAARSFACAARVEIGRELFKPDPYTKEERVLLAEKAQRKRDLFLTVVRKGDHTTLANFASELSIELIRYGLEHATDPQSLRLLRKEYTNVYLAAVANNDLPGLLKFLADPLFTRQDLKLAMEAAIDSCQTVAFNTMLQGQSLESLPSLNVSFETVILKGNLPFLQKLIPFASSEALQKGLQEAILQNNIRAFHLLAIGSKPEDLEAALLSSLEEIKRYLQVVMKKEKTGELLTYFGKGEYHLEHLHLWIHYLPLFSSEGFELVRAAANEIEVMYSTAEMRSFLYSPYFERFVLNLSQKLCIAAKNGDVVTLKKLCRIQPTPNDIEAALKAAESGNIEQFQDVLLLTVPHRLLGEMILAVEERKIHLVRKLLFGTIPIGSLRFAIEIAIACNQTEAYEILSSLWFAYLHQFPNFPPYQIGFHPAIKANNLIFVEQLAEKASQKELLDGLFLAEQISPASFRILIQRLDTEHLTWALRTLEKRITAMQHIAKEQIGKQMRALWHTHYPM